MRQALRWRPAACLGLREPRPIQIRIGRFFLPARQPPARHVMVADTSARLGCAPTDLCLTPSTSAMTAHGVSFCLQLFDA